MDHHREPKDHREAVLLAIRLTSLKDRLQSELSFSHHELSKEFPGFMSQAVRLAESSQLVDSGRSKQSKDKSNKFVF